MLKTAIGEVKNRCAISRTKQQISLY